MRRLTDEKFGFLTTTDQNLLFKPFRSSVVRLRLVGDDHQMCCTRNPSMLEKSICRSLEDTRFDISVLQ